MTENSGVSVSEEERPDEEPERKHTTKCCCYRDVGARQCFNLRYRRDYIFGENYGADEQCECPCHDAEIDDEHDFYAEQSR